MLSYLCTALSTTLPCPLYLLSHRPFHYFLRGDNAFDELLARLPVLPALHHRREYVVLSFQSACGSLKLQPLIRRKVAFRQRVLCRVDRTERSGSE